MANLPDDILLIIQLKLPVKSLLRFKSVSRSWKATISDARFIRMHLDRSKLLRGWHNLFVRNEIEHRIGEDYNYICQQFSLIRVGDGKIQVEANLEVPGGAWWCWEAVECTCDGVMLLSEFYGKHILWNPSTRNQMLLPYKFHRPLKFGICYDPITMDDFKVVVFDENQYAVYSCKSESWSEKMNFPFSLIGVSPNPGVFIDGVVYWAVSKEIIYFDRDHNDFKTLCKPEHVMGDDVFHLVRLRGCLCLYVETGDHVRIWKKEKDTSCCCWKELMVVENVQRLRPMWRFTPICIIEDNDNIVIQLDGGARCVVYSPSEKTFRQFEEMTSMKRLAPCVQSLLFPSRGSRGFHNLSQ